MLIVPRGTESDDNFKSPGQRPLSFSSSSSDSIVARPLSILIGPCRLSRSMSVSRSSRYNATDGKVLLWSALILFMTHQFSVALHAHQNRTWPSEPRQVKP